jgi:hypothetical protein
MGFLQQNQSLSHSRHELMAHIIRLLSQVAHLRSQLETKELELHHYVRQEQRLSKIFN